MSEQSRHLNLFIQIKKMEYIDNTRKKKTKRNGRHNQIGFESQLYKRKVLAPLTSVALNGDLLVRFEIEC